MSLMMLLLERCASIPLTYLEVIDFNRNIYYMQLLLFQLHQMSHHMLHTYPNFSASGLFGIDNTFIFTVSFLYGKIDCFYLFYN